MEGDASHSMQHACDDRCQTGQKHGRLGWSEGRMMGGTQVRRRCWQRWQHAGWLEAGSNPDHPVVERQQFVLALFRKEVGLRVESHAEGATCQSSRRSQ